MATSEDTNRAPGRTGHRLVFEDKAALILVVDDSPANLLLLSEVIINEGGKVRLADSGQKALELAELEPRPDLILLDIMMPGMDGHTVLRELRNRRGTTDIPVIFVTALDSVQEEEQGLLEGAVDFVTKPIRMPVLLARVCTQIEARRARHLLATQKKWLEQEVDRRIRENTRLDTRLKLALESSGFGIWEFDHEHQVAHWSDSLCQMLGRDSGPRNIDEALALFHLEDAPLLAACREKSASRNTADIEIAELRARHADGSWHWVESRSRTIDHDADGKPLFTIGTMLDISQRKAAEAERQLASAVLTGINDGICITSPDHTIQLTNPAFSRSTGYSPQELLGMTPGLLKSGVHGSSFYRDIHEKLDRHGNWQGEITNRRKDGSLLTEWLNLSSLRDASGNISHYVGIYSDLSERKEAAERIQYLSSYDTLTELPNRNLFTDRLEQAIITARRHDKGTAVILLDLDRFRLINDTLGPPTGDELLIEVARRLQLQVRDGDTVGRRAGNEFGFVMASLAHERDALVLAQRILEALAVPFEIGGQSMGITASIGISVSPKNGQDAETLLKCADAALLRAKQAGRNTFRFYSPEMDADAERRLAIESGLRNALECEQMSVHYQPQISLESGHMIGMEALLRWTHPDLGNISPAEFIPIAEETGHIVPIGLWVLKTACKQTKEWLDLGMQPLRVSVNLSPRQFRQPNLVSQISEALAESGLPATALELEITETAFIDDIDEAVSVCRKLKAMGLHLSLDDFGTGYSSLSYISRFPFDKLKIDQSFVRDIVENPVNAAVATAAIVMARSLNLSVLAEGVETEAQASFLRGRRCNAIQGYLFSRPLSSGDFGQLLPGNKRLPMSDAPASDGRTLLLVDDEPHILSALTRMLRREGYNILSSTSPQEAFDLLAKHSVQVVISDQRMPEMSGTEFLSRVRQLYPDTVRIVLTGYTDLESVTGAINRGAIYKFLTKPWDDDQLREQIREAFRLAKLNQDHSLSRPEQDA